MTSQTLYLSAAMLGIFSGALLGYVMGKYHERIQWNQLIHRGVLPKPV